MSMRFRRLETAWMLVAFILAGPATASDEVGAIAFGSCLRQHRPQPIWEAVLASRPDLFLFLGDNVYANSAHAPVMRKRYRMLALQPGYQKLIASVPILATWDDHDYGRNDAGAEFEAKEAAKDVFVEFFDIPSTSPIRSRPGIYQAQTYGPPGRRIQVIMLDTRYFRGPLKRGYPTPECHRVRYVPNTDPAVTLLGDAQWTWLGEQLRRPAELRIIASSIQLIPDQHCFEKWANLPRERQRLLRLIRATGAQGVVVISGDRHLAEISRLDDGELPYPLYEVTSSGLNSAGAGAGESNRYRTTADNFRGDNFGFIHVDWEENDPPVALQVRDVAGRVALEETVPLSRLNPR